MQRIYLPHYVKAVEDKGFLFEAKYKSVLSAHVLTFYCYLEKEIDKEDTLIIDVKGLPIQFNQPMHKGCTIEEEIQLATPTFRTERSKLIIQLPVRVVKKPVIDVVTIVVQATYQENEERLIIEVNSMLPVRLAE